MNDVGIDELDVNGHNEDYTSIIIYNCVLTETRVYLYYSYINMVYNIIYCSTKTATYKNSFFFCFV